MTAKPKAEDPPAEASPAPPMTSPDAPVTWQANDIFDVIRRLIAETAWTDREKTMAEALTDAHGSQHVANTELFHATLAVHSGLLGLAQGSPELSKALAENGYPK